MSSSVIFVRSFLTYATRRDLDMDALLEYSGLSRHVLREDASHRISDITVNNLWKNAVRMSGDPFFGLHLGEAMQLPALELVGQVIQLSNTVGEALSHAANLLPFITDLYTIEVTREAHTFTTYLRENEEACKQYPDTARQVADYLLAFILHEMDGLLLERISPHQVQIPAPFENPEYIRVLRTPNVISGTEWRLTFPSWLLQTPLVTSNYGYQKYFLKEISRLQLESGNPGPLKNRVFNHLLSNSYLYDIRIGAVAANFNTSTRSLQRQLKKERTSFLEIAEEVRKLVAIKQVRSGKYAVKEIAYSLGYNESSAFIKAFRRWTGTTPSGFLESNNP